ncbi:hypothetical protein IPF86_00930 [Candidatus Nomurabacteria bacterium]|jgi:hypothetical protein|nr:MAG: hypothetical protein IPF86_00930 [Candidatus Nomurabacteria bacterium]
MKFEYKGSLYTLIITECKEQLNQKCSKEIIIRKKDSGFRFDTFMLHQVMNTVVSLLYPHTFQEPGTETVVSLSLLNKPVIEKNPVTNKEIHRELVGINDVIYGYIKDSHCICSGDTNNFQSFDIRIEFFVRGGKIAAGRMQVYRSNDKFVPYFNKK